MKREYKGRTFTVRPVKGKDYVSVRINGKLATYCEDQERAESYINKLIATLGVAQ